MNKAVIKQIILEQKEEIKEFSQSKIIERKVEKKARRAVKLSGQSFIVGDYQGGSLNLLNNISHGKSFAASGNAKQSLRFIFLF